MMQKRVDDESAYHVDYPRYDHYPTPADIDRGLVSENGELLHIAKEFRRLGRYKMNPMVLYLLDAVIVKLQADA